MKLKALHTEIVESLQVEGIHIVRENYMKYPEGESNIYAKDQEGQIIWFAELPNEKDCYSNDMVVRKDGLIQSSKYSFSGSIFELGTGVNYSINELAKMFGEKYPIDYIPKREGEMLTTLCDISEAKEKINYNPIQDLESYVNKWIQDNL